jgi:hypothetical protein
MSYKFKRPIKTFKLVNFKILKKTLKYIQILQTRRLNYLKKALNTLRRVVLQYKKANTELISNFTYKVKPVQLLKKVTRTFYSNKLRDKDQKKKKWIGELKNVLTEKITNSLRHFTSRNFTL